MMDADNSTKNNIESSNKKNIKEKTNSKDDNDPSKWSKSKKKRMRAKFSKMAKRQGKSSGEHPTKQESPTETTSTPPVNEDCGVDQPELNEEMTKTISTPFDSGGKQSKGNDEVNAKQSNREDAKDKKFKKKKRKKSKEANKDKEETSSAVVADTNITNNEYQHQKDIKKQKLDSTHNNNDNITNNISNTSRFAFKVDEADHCETPIAAYQDIVDVLDKLASSLNKSRSSLIIYDPYFCDGGIKKKLASIGFTNVINNNSDFYKNIKEKTIPDYDILLTNPPYSGAHMGKLLKYCKEIATQENKKPFLLLLPHYVYTKDYYQLMLGPKVSSSVFFLVPLKRYNYIPPTWVDAEKGSKALADGRKQDTAPFPSFWYCHTNTATKISSDWLENTFGKSGTVRPIHRSKLRYAEYTKDIPREFRGEFDPNNKRANPRARKRATKMKREAAAAAPRSGY